ncbi:sporulation transcription factor Spo0A [Symbiobacterium terraclitae]|uniref:sporulation transcription factor Spo0A n=1 Tax=Symbiobacterium terraclitae TaxID=557451 RepID=UPI0035B53D67
MVEGRTTVVIANDNYEERQRLMDQFDGMSEFAVVGEARHGLEAVELVRSLRPDLLILDDVLPHLDGLGVLAQLEPGQRPNVLLLLSCASDRLVQHYYENGATYCLLRPCPPELVAERALLVSGHPASLQGGSAGRATPSPRTIAELLRRSGVPAHLQGYRFLKDAVQYVLSSNKSTCGMTKELYPHIARLHGTQPNRVERSIRHAIEVAWGRADINDLQRLFGATVHHVRGKPTNSEFVAMLADHLRGAVGS